MRRRLVILLVLAATFYFWHLGRNDIITDESSLATRAIGLVDFDFGIEQPTPWQWADEIPWWMRLSFHDQPPLVLLLQHWSMRLFGENPFTIRLPSVLAGLAAVVFVHLIGKRLYGSKVGIVSASLFAFTLGHIWITRLGLQESMVIALMLASAHFFFLGLEREKFFPLAGLFLGLAFLAKHYVLILLPIFATIIMLKRRLERREEVRREEVHANWPDRVNSRINPAETGSNLKADINFWKISIAAIIFLVVASPVIIYNIQLYRNFGHFDFQFSLLFGQEVKEWPSRPGQEVLGSYANRVKNYLPWLIESNSPYFLALAALGLATIVVETLRQKRTPDGRPQAIRHWLLVICFIWFLPFLVFIGPAYRFLALLTPWLAIAAGYALARLSETTRAKESYSQILKNLRIETRAAEAAGTGALWLAIVVVLAAIEAAYAYNSVIVLKPRGREPWTYAQLHRYNQAWGFNELEGHLAEKLEGKMPEAAITFEFPFARKIINAARAEGERQGLEAVPWGIVYNDNINLSATLWTFLRRITYHGWPIMTAADFRRGGREFLTNAGIRKILFINATAYALQDRPRPPLPDGDILESELRRRGALSQEIKNPKGEIAFRAYSFELAKKP